VLRLLRLMTTAANMLPPRMWVAILVMLARGAHAKKPRRRSRWWKKGPAIGACTRRSGCG